MEKDAAYFAKRVRETLGDSSGKRFPDEFIAAALHETLTAYERFFPVDWLADDPFIHLPAPHEQLLVNGASAAALRIRLRAVTEIHGKRAEDLTALKTQAETLHAAFTREIEERARADSSENPFQTGAAWNI